MRNLLPPLEHRKLLRRLALRSFRLRLPASLM
jgi:hypothetical protein